MTCEIDYTVINAVDLADEVSMMYMFLTGNSPHQLVTCAYKSIIPTTHNFYPTNPALWFLIGLDILYSIGCSLRLKGITVKLSMKRKADQLDDLELAEQTKKRPPSHQDRFRDGLFDAPVLDKYRKSYGASEP